MTDHGARYVAVDLGASSGRVIVGRLDGERIRTVETARFANRPVHLPGPGAATLHWDILQLWSGVLDGLRGAGGLEGCIASVAVDSWAVDYGLLDADGSLLGNPVHYRDRRTESAPGRVLSRIPPEALYRLTGVQLQPFNTIFQIVAAAASAQLETASRLLLIPDLVGYWLSGVEIAELTNASTTGMLDVVGGTWSAEVVEHLRAATATDLRRLLAPVVEPGSYLGTLRPMVADLTGLAGAHLVAVGSHDTASAVAAVPMTRPDAAYISSGTWSLVGLELDRPVLSDASRAANFTNEQGVGGTIRFIRNVAGLWLLQESMRTWRDWDVSTLLGAAAGVPALACVIDVDDPTLVSPGDMPRRIADLARRAGQRPPRDAPETARCVLDSLALAYRRALRDAADLSGREIGVVHIVGGGARNDLLCQLTADATGLPVIAGPAEGTAVGNLLVQALADGSLTGGLEAVREVVARSTDLTRWEPRGCEADWSRAERRLRDSPAGH